MGNRVYHVYTGRFLTRDPSGAGNNDYEYAGDNPLRYIDPSGLKAEDGLAFAESKGDGAGTEVIETDTTYDSNGKVVGKPIVSQYLIIDNPDAPGLKAIQMPNGTDLYANIKTAQDFCSMIDHKPLPSGPFSPKPLMPGGAMSKASAKLGWALGTMGPLMRWDYKTKGAQYEEFGAFNAGAVAAAMGYDKSTYVDGAEVIHHFANPFKGNEPETMTAAGYDFLHELHGALTIMQQSDQKQDDQANNKTEEGQQSVWPPPVLNDSNQQKQTISQDRGSWFGGAVLGFVIFIIAFVGLGWVEAGFAVHQMLVQGNAKYLASFSLLRTVLEYVGTLIVCNLPNLLIFLARRKKRFHWALGVLCGGGLGILFTILIAWLLGPYVS